MSIELETIAESGKAPRTRIKDVKSAHSIYMAMRQADDASSLDRVKIQSMLDGEPPYSPNQLKALGQGYRANLNFGEASAALETALSAYSDLVNSVDKLVSVKTSFGDPSQRLEWENIISEEFHRTVLARVFVSWIFIKPYYTYNVVSIYEFLEKRFGPQSRQAASAIFLVTRALASGTRLYVPYRDWETDRKSTR